MPHLDHYVQHEHRVLVETFAAGWRQPQAHAWDELLADDVELSQPLLRNGRRRRLWQQEVSRLLAFLPDLTGHVLGWASRDHVVFIEIELTTTAGGKPLTIRAVDRLTVAPSGLVARRDSHFDPTIAMMALLRRPGTWVAWWRSGIGSFSGVAVSLRAKRPSAELPV